MRLPTLAAFQEAAAFVHETLDPTPQIAWPLLAERTGAQVWVKHENHTPIGAFKVRGGLVFMDDLRRHGPVEGVIAATRGNHGQSIAFAAARLGLASTLVVPEGNAAGKNAAMAAFGGELVVHGADFEAAFDRAQALAAERGLAMVPSFDERLIRGVGTYALELFTAVPDLDAVYVPVGLGSGICGLMGVRDALGLKTEIIGVVAEGANCYALSFEARRPVSTNRSTTVVGDGIATRVPSARGAGGNPRRLRPDRQRLRRRNAGCHRRLPRRHPQPCRGRGRFSARGPHAGARRDGRQEGGADPLGRQRGPRRLCPRALAAGLRPRHARGSRIAAQAAGFRPAAVAAGAPSGGRRGCGLGR